MAAEYDFNVDAGATFQKTITWKNGDGVPYDLTGATARMHIRKKVSDETVIVSLTTENGKIRITPLGGEIHLYMDDLDTMLLPARSVYDIEVIMPSTEDRPIVTRILQGAVVCNKNVTRES